MHLSDGVLSMPVIIGSTAGAAALVGYGLKGVQQEEIPKISLMTATFFTLSMLSVPIGPSSTHPLMIGLMGIMLKKRSSLAIFIGLLIQAMLFGHGGLTALGANTLMVALPAVCVGYAFTCLSRKVNQRALYAGILATLGILLCVTLLVFFLSISDARYHEGFFSTIRLLVVAHLPLACIEGILTFFTVAYLSKVKPELLQGV